MMEPQLEIMVNTCYGGFSISEAAMDEYRRRCPDRQEFEYYHIDRHDPVMVEIVKELGTRANGLVAQIELRRIPALYAGHYSIGEYDGMENVVIHRNTYKVDATRAILLNRALTKSEKLARVSAVLNTDI